MFKSSLILLKFSFLALCCLKVACKVAISFSKYVLSFNNELSSSLSSANVFFLLALLVAVVVLVDSYVAVPLDLGQLDSSKPSAVAEGEPVPPLQESGVVGLHLVAESAPCLLMFLCRETTPSNLDADLERGSRMPHLSGIDSNNGDEEEEAAVCDCLSRTRSSTTSMSSVIAALIHSSLTTIISANGSRKRERQTEKRL